MYNAHTTHTQTHRCARHIVLASKTEDTNKEVQMVGPNTIYFILLEYSNCRIRLDDNTPASTVFVRTRRGKNAEKRTRFFIVCTTEVGPGKTINEISKTQTAKNKIMHILLLVLVLL